MQTDGPKIKISRNLTEIVDNCVNPTPRLDHSESAEESRTFLGYVRHVAHRIGEGNSGGAAADSKNLISFLRSMHQQLGKIHDLPGKVKNINWGALDRVDR